MLLRSQRFKPASEEPNEAGQAYRRKQVGLGDATPCGGGGECALGGGDIRPPPQQIGGGTDADLRNMRQAGCCNGGTDKVLRRLAEEHGKGVGRSADTVFDPGQARLDRGTRGLSAKDGKACASAREVRPAR